MNQPYSNSLQFTVFSNVKQSGPQQNCHNARLGNYELREHSHFGQLLRDDDSIQSSVVG